MKKSSIIVLSLAFLLSIVYFVTRQDKVSVGVKKIALPSFSKEAADKIEIGTKDKVSLIKKDGKWYIKVRVSGQEKEVLAESSSVESMLDAALSLKHSHYVTELKEKYEELGLLDDQKTIVSIFSKDKELFSIELGKSLENNARYVKLPNSQAVYAMQGSFWQLTRSGPLDFRHKEILSLQDDDLREFKFYEKEDLKLAFVREDEKKPWEFLKDFSKASKDFRLKESEVLSLIRAGSSLRASGFLDEEKTLLRPDYSMEIKDKENKLYKISFYKADNDKYLVKNDSESQIYEISKYNFDRLNKNIEDLRDLSVMKINNANISKFKLYTNKSYFEFNKKDDKWEFLNKPENFDFDPETVSEKISILSSLNAKKIAQNNDQPKNPNWLQKPLVEMTDKDGKKISLFASELKNNAEYELVKGNIDEHFYLVPKSEVSIFKKGLESFKKVEFELPPIDERTKGFESLPVDVQRKLLESTKKKK